MFRVAQECAATGDCLICREPLAAGKKLSCSHCFHVDCLRMWLQHKQSCPLCRADIEVRDSGLAAAAQELDAQFRDADQAAEARRQQALAAADIRARVADSVDGTPGRHGLAEDLLGSSHSENIPPSSAGPPEHTGSRKAIATDAISSDSQDPLFGITNIGTHAKRRSRNVRHTNRTALPAFFVISRGGEHRSFAAMEGTSNNIVATVRAEPAADAAVVRTIKPGTLVFGTKCIRDKEGHFWIRIADGCILLHETIKSKMYDMSCEVNLYPVEQGSASHSLLKSKIVRSKMTLDDKVSSIVVFPATSAFNPVTGLDEGGYHGSSGYSTRTDEIAKKSDEMAKQLAADVFGEWLAVNVGPSARRSQRKAFSVDIDRGASEEYEHSEDESEGNSRVSPTVPAIFRSSSASSSSAKQPNRRTSEQRTTDEDLTQKMNVMHRQFMKLNNSVQVLQRGMLKCQEDMTALMKEAKGG
jgi:hypothetical protein